MIDWLIYSVQVSLVSGLLYGCYLLLFRRMSFFQLNRVTILGIMLFSLLSPLLSVPMKEELFPAAVIEWQGAMEFSEGVITRHVPETTHTDNISWAEVLLLIYGMGILFGGLQLLFRIWNVYKLRQAATYHFIDNQAYYLTDHPSAPFAIWRWIFVPARSDEPLPAAVLVHETAHVRQGHTIDLALIEGYCLFFWMNPFAYLLKRELRQVHEFLADAYVLRAGHQLAAYLQLLKQLTLYPKGPSTLFLPQMFTSSTLFKRVHMMTKKRTSPWKKAVYLSWLPVVALVLLAFAPQTDQLLPRSSEAVSLLSVGQVEQIQTWGDEDIPSIHPIGADHAYRMTSGFGMRRNPMTKQQHLHRGEDFAAPLGTPVVATAAGVIVENRYVDPHKGYGRMVVIRHSEAYVTRYAHLDRFEGKVGQRVSKGELIGRVGSSGQSFAPHLHYEILKNGKPQNPAAYYSH